MGVEISEIPESARPPLVSSSCDDEEGGLLLVVDDAPVCARAVTAADGPLLDEWFESLSPASRRLRFFGPKNHLSESDRRRLLDLDGGCGHSLVATVRDAAGGEHPVALGGFVCDAGRSDEAEMAVAVIDRFQGRGVGGALLRRLGRSALRHGITRLEGEVLWENGTMRALLRRLAPGARGEPVGGGAIRYRLAADELAW